MPKHCDNKSVGIIVRNGENILLITRKNFPVSFALPAGHLDGDTYEDAAIREAYEETNLQITQLKKVYEAVLYSPCKRVGGSHHAWHIYEALEWNGIAQAGSDASLALWTPPALVNHYVEHTLSFSEKIGVDIGNLSEFVRAVSQNPEWIKNPGLEPVWIILLKKIGIL